MTPDQENRLYVLRQEHGALLALVEEVRGLLNNPWLSDHWFIKKSLLESLSGIHRAISETETRMENVRCDSGGYRNDH
jgi:hypothetical protein